MSDLPHKPKFIEQELLKICANFPHGCVSENYFQVLVAEALLILLQRTEKASREARQEHSLERKLDALTEYVTGQPYPDSFQMAVLKREVAELREALERKRDETIEWVAGQTKVQHCTPAWCLTDSQIRALKGKP